MGLVLFLMAGIWALGWVMKTPIRARLVMIGLMYLAVVIAQIVLPQGTPLRVAMGGDVRPWLVLGGAVGLVFLYIWGLKRLRRLAPKPAEASTPQSGPFREAELSRYARHIVLRELGGAGQRRLKDAKVLVIGAGGLGSPALLYLAAAGVGTIGVIDDDTVDGSNLQRQIIHRDQDIGTPKVFSAQAAMQALNPFITVKPYKRRLDDAIAETLFAEYDLVLDGSDNFDTRYLANRAAVATGTPLLSGAITQWEGQISLYHPASGAPCYECVFPARPADGLAPNCAEAGVIAPLPGIVGSQMALEAIKEITDAGQSLRGRMMLHDALYGENRSVMITRREDCACCGSVQGQAQT